MKDYKQNEIIFHKEEALEIADEMCEVIGNLCGLYEQLESLGYEDYKIEQELKQGYMGDTLRNLVDELPERIQREVDEEELEGKVE